MEWGCLGTSGQGLWGQKEPRTVRLDFKGLAGFSLTRGFTESRRQAHEARFPWGGGQDAADLLGPDP